ncbi:hypothetical protein [Geobacter sp. SVR]|uniref:hypothetical protein n=1 Tax=Geobacter sp. SVR TaxID=2495594 RepID=UPI00143EFAE0|nr:hypothetical protein [Geobacter sp. SVR]BCS54760.1 hypothetical protein GSVR_30680 [Geobacter sp. SVR]GCF86432.1 hypothetical protein GSbR_30320 [Geobacter sp. SVR]
MKELMTTTGDIITQAYDAEGLAPEEGWFKPVKNPFVHGCCDCGLVHQVEFCFVDKGGHEIVLAEGDGIALRFARDAVETANLRAQKAMIEARNVSLPLAAVSEFLHNEVPMEAVEMTTFDGVFITELGRIELLKLVALLAAQGGTEK